jgi:rubrerythrin
MAFKQTKDVLDHAREFHSKLGDLYERMAKRAKAEKTRELLQTLTGHERVLESRLAEYETEVSKLILNTFFKYMVNEKSCCIDDYTMPEWVDTDEVIRATREFDICLTNFYREMARKALSRRVREVLLNLMEMELREQMALSKHALVLASS